MRHCPVCITSRSANQMAGMSHRGAFWRQRTEGTIMAKAKDPVDVVAGIRRSIEVSQKGSRRVRCHSLRALFGFQAWTAQRKELVTSLLENEGIRAQPPVAEAGLQDWIVL